MNQRWIPAALAATSMLAAELPVKRVVLYKHGVGYFERGGDLAAGESARLDFKASDMNDVLKSLTVTETGGGKITGLRYDSAMPLSRRLSEYSFQIGAGVPLAQFLDQFKGAAIEMDLGGKKVAGSLVSGRVIPPTAQQPQRDLLVVLNPDGDLQTVDLTSVGSLRLADPVLQRQLREYLSAVSGSRTQDQRSVYIDSSDNKGRQVAASYLIPTPVWKSSYRLVFRNTPQPLLEGWAIVDNTTSDDWTNIRLALVSGKPISFQSRLYDPKFIQRPFAELPEDEAVAPTVYGGVIGGIAGGAGRGMAPPPPPAPAAFRAQSKASMAPQGALAMEAEMQDVITATSSVAVSTEGRDLGELFEYSFGTPVTVKRNQSAMLPFLQQPIDARKLLIYTDHSAQNPRTAAELSNQTGKTLDGGPITVFDNNAYAGEALVETVKAGDKRLISYGIDLGTRVTTKIGSGTERYLDYKASRGILTVKVGMEQTTTYTIQNVDNRAKTLLIERPIREGFQLLSEKPTEVTATMQRFSVNLKPSATETFAVREDHVHFQTMSLHTMTPDTLSAVLVNRTISAAARQSLEAIAAKKKEIAEADRQMRDATQRIQALTTDQDRLRQNLASLRSITGQQETIQRYARDLAAREEQIVTLRDQSSAAQTRKSALESELRAMVERLEF